MQRRYPTYDFVEYFGKLQNLKCECKSFVEAKPQHIQFEAHDHQNAQFKVKTNNSKSRLQCSIAHSLKPPSFFVSGAFCRLLSKQEHLKQRSFLQSLKILENVAFHLNKKFGRTLDLNFSCSIDFCSREKLLRFC